MFSFVASVAEKVGDEVSSVVHTVEAEVSKQVERRKAIETQHETLADLQQKSGDEFPGSDYHPSDRKTWMSGLGPEKIHINKVVWPGTHDSATNGIGIMGITRPFAECQTLSIYDQLVSGTRVLDIRINEEKHVCHGILSSYEVQDVLNDIKKFLSETESEVIIFEIRTEFGQKDPPEFDKYLSDELGEFLIHQDDQVFTKTIAELLPKRVICIWKPRNSPAPSAGSPLWSSEYLKDNWIDTDLPWTKFESNLKYLGEQPNASNRNFFYRVENTVTPQADNPDLTVRSVTGRIHGYARLFIAQCFSKGIADRLQILSTDFIEEDFVDACVGLTQARIDANAIADEATSVAKSVVDGASATATTVADETTSVAKTVADGASSAAKTVADETISIAKTVADGTSSAVTTVADETISIAKVVGDETISIVNTVADAEKTVIDEPSKQIDRRTQIAEQEAYLLNLLKQNGDKFPGSDYHPHDRKQWMSGLNPHETQMNKIVWPGTHDSATNGIGIWLITRPFAECQTLSIYDQLVLGTRVLDIRIQKDRNVCHGILVSYGINVVINDIKKFLSETHSEIIILEVRTEYGHQDPPEFDKYLIEQLGGFLIHQDDRVFTKTIAELLPKRIICVWKPRNSPEPSAGSLLWSSGYLRDDWTNTDLPRTKFDANLTYLGKQQPASERKFFYRVENTATPVWDDPTVRSVTGRIHKYARLFINRCFAQGIADRLQIFSIDFIDENFVDACVGLTQARIDGKA